MRKLFFLILLLIAYFSHAQTKDISWYKMLNGKIDKYAVTMHLHKAGHQFAGYYYYNNQQNPVYFTGEDSTKAGTINLMAYSDYNGDYEIFQFALNNGILKGTWKKSESSKALSFVASENKSDSLTAFTYIYTTGSIKLRPKLKGTPEASFEEAAVWPLGNGAKDVYLKKIIRGLFNSPTSNDDIGKILLSNKKKFLADYITEFKDVKDAEIKEAPMGYSSDESMKVLVVYQSPRTITLAQSSYTYSGGAHGMYGTGYTSMDIINQKKIELKDVFNDAGIKSLAKLLEKYFRKTYNLAATETLTDGGLFENKIEPSENFYVTEKGIGFCYNPYEIGPYAMGEINLFIPFTEFTTGLKSFAKN